MTDLEQLSRDAAKVLFTSAPTILSGEWDESKIEPDGLHYERNGKLFYGKVATLWLHESTEACAEIMVKVLLPKGIQVYGTESGDCGLCKGHGFGVYAQAIFNNADPMQAFRTAVLRALIEVKK